MLVTLCVLDAASWTRLVKKPWEISGNLSTPWGRSGGAPEHLSRTNRDPVISVLLLPKMELHQAFFRCECKFILQVFWPIIAELKAILTQGFFSKLENFWGLEWPNLNDLLRLLDVVDCQEDPIRVFRPFRGNHLPVLVLCLILTSARSMLCKYVVSFFCNTPGWKN